MIQAAREVVFLEMFGGQDSKIQHMLATACEVCAWLAALPRRMNGTEMCNLEFCNAMQLCYNFCPLGLEQVCKGCSGKFLVEHAMSCKLGGLVSRRHKAVKQEFIHLGKLAFGHSNFIDKHKIIYACGVRAPAGVTVAALRSGISSYLAWVEACSKIAINGL